MKALVTILVLIAAVGWSSAGASPTATVLDRTYDCTVRPEYDDVRVINFGGNQRRKLSNGHTDFGRVGVSTEAAGELNTNLVSISNGPIPFQHPTGSIVVTRTACAQIRSLQIPLVPRGLPGPPIRYEKGVECRVPRRVLIRFRGVLDRQPRFAAAGDGNVIARANVSEAQLAVSTYPTRPAARKPVAFAAFDKLGGIRIWFAPTCE